MFGKSRLGAGKTGKSSSLGPEATSRQSNAAQRDDAPLRHPGAPRMAEVTRKPYEHPDALAQSGAQAGDTEGKRLIVGREICLSGEIKTCDQLVVEGRVEANLTDSRCLEIAETGFFKGSASIEEADISGQYQGDLVVKGCLRIRAGGRVEGSVHYGELEIERGGRISGTIGSEESEDQMSRRLSAAEFVHAAATEPKVASDGPEPAPLPAEKTGSVGS